MSVLLCIQAQQCASCILKELGWIAVHGLLLQPRTVNRSNSTKIQPAASCFCGHHGQGWCIDHALSRNRLSGSRSRPHADWKEAVSHWPR